MSRQTQVLVVGGGAAGLMAAITAAERSRDVILLEGNDRVGKKILATGNGKCNFTNEILDPTCYHGEDTAFISAVLNRFSGRDLRAWFRSAGIESVVKDGRVYPRSEQASAVLDALRVRLEATSAQTVTDAKVMSVRQKDDLLEVQTVRETYLAGSVILAAGSAASPKTGSDGSGYRLAEQMGLRVKEPLPALTHLKLKAGFTKSWAGVRCDGSIMVCTGDKQPAGSSKGQLQLTAYGISGIPAFEVSRFASRALAEGDDVEVHIDFLTDIDGPVEDYLRQRAQKMAPYPVSQFLNGLVPKNLAGVLLRESGCDRKKECARLTEDEIRRIASLMTDLCVPVTGTGGFEQAQVCTGGVTLDQLDPQSMACRACPSLYVVGELTDIDGICGGYNLQWAFATGHLAGSHA